MSHSHTDSRADYNRAFAIGVVLNVIFVAIEAGYGLFSGSLALVADAGHNLSDVLSLLLAWGANMLAGKKATERRTYGFRKATVMASLASGVLLLIALGGITWEAFGRILEPRPVAGTIVIAVAGVGVIINSLTALLFIKGQKDDLNIKGAFLHMAADAGVSLGVVIAGGIIMLKGWLWIDPAISLLIVAVILVSTWGLLRDSLNYAMDVAPGNVDIPAIRSYLSNLPSVERIHDLHIWPLSTTETALTVHIVVISPQLNNSFLYEVQEHLRKQYGIAHATIQVETTRGEDVCLLDSKKCI